MAMFSEVSDEFVEDNHRLLKAIIWWMPLDVWQTVRDVTYILQKYVFFLMNLQQQNSVIEEP